MDPTNRLQILLYHLKRISPNTAFFNTKKLPDPKVRQADG